MRQPGLGSKAMFLKKVVCVMWKCLKEFCIELIQCTLNKFMFVRIRAKREEDKLLFVVTVFYIEVEQVTQNLNDYLSFSF